MRIQSKNNRFAPPTKDNPIWTQNEFIGPPPIGYSSWSEWVDQSTETGFFTGVKIQAINPPHPSDRK